MVTNRITIIPIGAAERELPMHRGRGTVGGGTFPCRDQQLFERRRPGTLDLSMATTRAITPATPI